MASRPALMRRLHATFFPVLPATLLFIFIASAACSTIEQALAQPAAVQKRRVLVARGACARTVFAYRPHTIGISCDRTFSLRAIHWTSYGGSVALGRGRARTQGCTPACANGRVRMLPVRIRLSKVVTCGGRQFYAHMHYRLRGRLLPGFRRQDTLSMIATNEFGEALCSEERQERRQHRQSFWRNCGPASPDEEVTTIAHRVRCRKARRVIRRTYSKGQSQAHNGIVIVQGFRCRIAPDSARAVRCRKGGKLIWGPLPG
jgi:hypothetical protein